MCAIPSSFMKIHRWVEERIMTQFPHGGKHCNVNSVLFKSRESKWDVTCETKICSRSGVINFATNKTAYLRTIAPDFYITDQDEQQVPSCRLSAGLMEIALSSTAFMLPY